MNLDKVAAELRRRKGAGSIDMGILLGRRFYWDVLRPWLMLVVPLLIAVQLALAVVIHPLVGILAGWWLKPLFDRVTLHVISRGFFGQIPSTKDTVQTVLRQWMSLEALKDLTWRRLSPARTMTMPIRILEGARGAQARARIKSLYGAGVRPGEQLGLLSLVVGFKWLFYLGLATLAVIIVPVELVHDPLALLQYLVEDAGKGVQIAALLGTTTIATTLAEPFFGAGGFGLYIQRRIEREGWDLELRFRRLAERVTSSLNGSIGLWLAAGLSTLLALAALTPTPVQAQEWWELDEGEEEEIEQLLQELESLDDEEFLPDEAGLSTSYDEDYEPDAPTAWDDESPPTPEELIDADLIPVDDPQAELDEQMGESPFVPRTETRTKWVPIEEEEEEESAFWEWLDDLFGDDDSDWSGLSNLLAIFGSLMRVLMWIVVIAALGVALWMIARYVQRRRGAQTVSDERATHWKEELVEEGEELVIPDDHVGREVRQMWAVGNQRQAMAVLLVVSLLRFEERRNYRFRVGWTTSRCAQKVRDVRPEGPVLALVARTFEALAWAGRAPTDAEFEALIQKWEAVFEAQGGQQ